jgi:hypothetical protein
MKGAHNVNADFQAELAALLGHKTTKSVGTEHFQDSSPERLREEQAKTEARRQEQNGAVQTLKAPGTETEKTNALQNSITVTQLFGDDAIEGQIPELQQDFVMLASRKDRLVELGTVAQEVYTTGKVCRQQMVAMESIARQIVPATPEEVESDSRRVLVADSELNMYTEEPSVVEAQSTIENTRNVIDGVLGDIKNSTIALAEKICSTAQQDMGDRIPALTTGISKFNQAIIRFLDNTCNTDLVETKLKFRSGLNWGNLMAMPLEGSIYMVTAREQSAEMENSIAAFDGTAAETLFKTLGEFLAKNSLAMPVISNFISGAPNLVTNNDDKSKSIEEMTGNNYLNYTQTFGHLFATFGSQRFIDFFNVLNQFIEQEVKNCRMIAEQVNGATDIESVTKMALALQQSHSIIMAAASNMAVICEVQQLVCNFLSSYR